MKIVKAEILFSRKCNLDCSYCGMVSGKENTRSVDEWKKGMDVLRSLDCTFAAFYGAEPLLEFDKLKQVVGYAESIGINTTIITSGAVPDFRDKLKELHDFGAKSLSMSYDINSTDSSSAIKSRHTLQSLQYFKSLGSVRDVAAIITLTRQNFHCLVDSVKYLTDRGIWTFFDFVHPDRGLPGSKCRGNAEDFIFLEKDLPQLHLVLATVLELKKQGYLVHVSEEYLNLMAQNNFSLLKNYNWNCAHAEVFPSWVTIDCDGGVHYCDDFQEQRKQPRFDMLNLKKDWNIFSATGKKLIQERCRGCAWSTHIDAHFIKLGVNDISSYVHGDW